MAWLEGSIIYTLAAFSTISPSHSLFYSSLYSFPTCLLHHPAPTPGFTGYNLLSSRGSYFCIKCMVQLFYHFYIPHRSLPCSHSLRTWPPLPINISSSPLKSALFFFLLQLLHSDLSIWHPFRLLRDFRLNTSRSPVY